MERWYWQRRPQLSRDENGSASGKFLGGLPWRPARTEVVVLLSLGHGSQNAVLLLPLVYESSKYSPGLVRAGWRFLSPVTYRDEGGQTGWVGGGWTGWRA